VHIAAVLGACAAGGGPAAPAPCPLTAVLGACEEASSGLREQAAYCPGCRAQEGGRCAEDADRLARAEEYDLLAEQFRSGQLALIVLPPAAAARPGALPAASTG
jgi:hypothetical protein